MTMYEWAPEKSEIRHVTSQNDLQFMKVSLQVSMQVRCSDPSVCSVSLGRQTQHLMISLLLDQHLDALTSSG